MIHGSFRLLLCTALLGTLAAARAAEADTRTLLFFGDSLTAGLGLEDPSSEAYPALIQEKIERAGLPWRVVNAGLSGETTSGGARRIDWILRQPVDIFVLALGANDGLRGIPPDVSRKNLEKILERVKARNPDAQLVVAGLQMPPQMGADFATAFARIFPAVAKKFDAAFVPFLLEGVGGVLEFNQPDRIHPNPEGHARIAETVWKVIKPLL